MNPRYVLAMSLALLFVVSELAGEGGPIDSYAASGTARQAAAAPPDGARSARVVPPAPGRDTSDFFANYEPPDTDEGWPTTAGDAADDRPSPVMASASGGVPRGALSLERLGVELPSPTGIAPEFVPG